jgi:hypothetical protein
MKPVRILQQSSFRSVSIFISIPAIMQPIMLQQQLLTAILTKHTQKQKHLIGEGK